MNLEEMRNLAGIILYTEYEIFRLSMLNKNGAEIYENAYKIDSYINLYEFLLEMCQEFGEHELKVILTTPNIIETLYEEWLSYEDSSSKDLTDFIRREVTIMQLTYLNEIELKQSA